MPYSLTQFNKKRRIVLCCFLFILLLLFSLPWFGHKNIAEIKGFIILRHPVAILGIMLFILSIFLSFKKKQHCCVVGGVGLLLLFITEIIEFLTIKTGSIKGFSFFLFQYDVIYFDKINLKESFSYALAGFYCGALFLIITMILFLVLTLGAAPQGRGTHSFIPIK